MIRPIQQDYLISHIVDKITGFLIEDFQLDIPSALNIVYTSDTFRALSDKETADSSPAVRKNRGKSRYRTKS